MATLDPQMAKPATHKEQPAPASTTKPLVSLPICEGPKLAPFTQSFEDLKFEPELVIRVEDNVHSLVIKAKLDGKTYGIKFVSVDPSWTTQSPLANRL
jgi:kinetochore complex Sim4 subunit Fta2